MKFCIVYYSQTGSTKRVAHFLKSFLETLGNISVDNIEINTVDEALNFLSEGKNTVLGVKAEIKDTTFDLSEYDYICFGTPVWGFGPAPAMHTYLGKCSGIKDKNVVIFATYEDELGARGCVNTMKHTLRQKGAKKFFNFNIKQSNARDKVTVFNTISTNCKLWW